MPNHVTTYIIVEKKETLKQLHELSKDKDGGLAEYLCPMPTEYSRDGWYEWRLAYWGTKWGFYNQNYCVNAMQQGVLQFQTAWSVMSDNLFNKLLRIFPNMEYEYECESGWGGQHIFQNGQRTFIETYDEPEWSEGVELVDSPDTEFTYLEREWRGHPAGWYRDWQIEEPVNCTETIRALDLHHEHLFRNTSSERN